MLPHKTLIGLSFFFALSLAAPLQVLDASESTLHARGGSPNSPYSPCSGKGCHPKPKSPTNPPALPEDVDHPDSLHLPTAQIPKSATCIKWGDLKSYTNGASIIKALKAAGDPLNYSDSDDVCYDSDLDTKNKYEGLWLDVKQPTRVLPGSDLMYS